ncbi:MAG: sulfatase-like hydrolase/transferase [Alkalispirochaeta sp.]
MKQKNVVFILTDDQRFDTIECVNNPEIITPNLNSLVEQGSYCSNAYIMGGTSAAVCMPSRAMVHSGKTLFHLQDAGETIPPDHTLMGEQFRAAGYSTYGIGKWHNGVESFERSFTGGDKIFFGGMDDHWNVPVCSYHPKGEFPAPQMHQWDGGTGEVVQIPKIYDEIEPGHHSTDMFSEAATEFLRSRGGGDEKPFLLYVAYMAPHDPRTMPKKYLEMYDPEKITLPKNFMPRHPFDNGEMDVRDEKLAGYPREGAEIKKHIAEYYAMITHLDDMIGSIVQEVEKAGLQDETIIVVAGDNGLALGSHGLMGKQNMYDHSLHVPLLFVGPGIVANQKVDEFCTLNDIFPTLCDLTGTTIPESVDGESLASLLTDATVTRASQERDKLLFAYRDIQRAVLDKSGNKLIVYFNEDGSQKREQLFNVHEDPLELEDLIEVESAGKMTEHLRRSMKELMSSMDDPMLRYM